MPAISQIRSLNTSFKALTPTVLVVGGTSGIGQFSALKLAEHTKPKKVIITGRSKEAGDAIVKSLNELTNHTDNEFIPCDVTLMKNIRAYAVQIREKVEKLNYLVLSPGFSYYGERDETEEGIDKKLACYSYARFLLMKELVPLLENAAKEGEEARVISVLAVGREGSLYEDDLALKKNYGVSSALSVSACYNSLMVEEFSKRHPAVSFTHINPGWVDTSISRNAPAVVRFPLKVIAHFLATNTQEDAGELITYVLTNETFKTGWHLVNKAGEKVQPSKHQTQKNIELMWKHMEESTSIK
jgi:NAD(P)-dependent dehydrogenase (short-subunit alcohol dehydrogenase family)